MSADSTALEICSQGPIHIPGAIQPHGALLLLEATWIQTRFFDVNAGEQNFEEALVKYMPDLLAFMKAEGTALYMNGRTTLLGITPPGDRMPALLNWFSRVGRMIINRTFVDMEELLCGVLDGLNSLMEPKGIEVRRPRPLSPVSCDSVMVREIFLNLLTNAAKYNIGSAPWIEIGWIENPEMGRCPVFQVSDNGIGIPEKHWDTVFTMFGRLHPQEAFGGGTGAGLAVVRSIAERHGGRPQVRAEPETGSIFSFTPG